LVQSSLHSAEEIIRLLILIARQSPKVNRFTTCPLT